MEPRQVSGYTSEYLLIPKGNSLPKILSENMETRSIACAMPEHHRFEHPTTSNIRIYTGPDYSPSSRRAQSLFSLTPCENRSQAMAMHLLDSMAMRSNSTTYDIVDHAEEGPMATPSISNSQLSKSQKSSLGCKIAVGLFIVLSICILLSVIILGVHFI
ncbi:unnamed protein product [Schistocephalus solidus]|uniref:MSP domain-containing protein n=1 Tax=Schistocephalus solidus TaxID=70667 RepID=A0A183SQW5_SCHSO|nr:unnamed protein product [Schistocephalus solidus]